MGSTLQHHSNPWSEAEQATPNRAFNLGLQHYSPSSAPDFSFYVSTKYSIAPQQPFYPPYSNTNSYSYSYSPSSRQTYNPPYTYKNPAPYTPVAPQPSPVAVLQLPSAPRYTQISPASSYPSPAASPELDPPSPHFAAVSTASKSPASQTDKQSSTPAATSDSGESLLSWKQFQSRRSHNGQPTWHQKPSPQPVLLKPKVEPASVSLDWTSSSSTSSSPLVVDTGVKSPSDLPPLYSVPAWSPDKNQSSLSSSSPLKTYPRKKGRPSKAPPSVQQLSVPKRLGRPRKHPETEVKTSVPKVSCATTQAAQPGAPRSQEKSTSRPKREAASRPKKYIDSSSSPSGGESATPRKFSSESNEFPLSAGKSESPDSSSTKSPSDSNKSLLSAGQPESSDESSDVEPSLVKLPIPRERLLALELFGRVDREFDTDINQELLRDLNEPSIPTFGGYTPPTRPHASTPVPSERSSNQISPSDIEGFELGHTFSYYGSTRLLPTYKPGRRILTPRATNEMGPSYRNSNRRQNRTVEHDILEGLPVRQWRKDYVSIAPPPSNENSLTQNDIWAVELPHGMPKDSHLLPQHCQDLLRAARSGKIYGKRPVSTEEEEVDPEVALGEKPEKKEEDTKIQGYTVKTWKQIPRHLEAPDVEYLAKPRKNLKTLTSKQTAVPTLTKATVKRTDATGAEYLQDVVVSHGQPIDGEVVSQTTIPDPNAQPLDPYAAPTPPKKKAPPNRKRPKGPGRGRKKKVIPTSAPAPPVPGAAPVAEGVINAAGPEGVKAEPGTGATPTVNEDVEMADGSNANSEDDEEEGDEGDDDEGSMSGQGSPSKRPRLSSPVHGAPPSMNEIPSLNSTPIPPLPSAHPLPPFVAHLEKEKLEAKSGSPLKNVALATSALTSPLTSPTTSSAPPFSDATPTITQPENDTAMTDSASLDHVMQEQAEQTAPMDLPPPPPEPSAVEQIAAVETRKEEEAEEEMLLDIVDNANNAQIGGEVPAPVTEPVAADEPITTTQGEIAAPIAVEPVAQSESVPEPNVAVEAPKEPEKIEPTKIEEQTVQAPTPTPVEPQSALVLESAQATEQAVEDDDDFPDLLGGLEKSLGKPVPAPAAALVGSLPEKPVADVKDGGDDTKEA